MSTKKLFVKSKNAYKVTFSIPKENFKTEDVVKVLGNFNNWHWEEAISMSPKGSDLKAEILLSPDARYEYRFLLNDQVWFNDRDADTYAETPFGVKNSVSVVPAAPAVKKSSSPVKAKVTAKKKKAVKKSVGKSKSKTTDKLTRIEGIGPKIESILKEQGIDTFASLGKSSVKKLTDILASAGNRYKMHDPGTWPKQAKLAAQNKWDELKALQQKLKGGKSK